MPQYQNKRTSFGARNNRGRSNYGGQRRQQGGGRSNRKIGTYINPAKFIREASAVNQESYKPENDFASFEINELLGRNLAAKGYTDPTPIQDKTIPAALMGNDIIGVASTGTGKTAAFALPIINRLMQDKSARALIIAPTRELAQQIDDELRSIAKGSGLFGAVIIGGTSMGPQLRDLRNNPDIVIGTPGRIKDHIERRTLNLSGFKQIVLDEVDRMLDMGFVHDVRMILEEVSSDRQSYFFSATLDARVKTLISGFTTDPVHITIPSAASSEFVNQDVVRFGSSEEKLEKLHDLLVREEVSKTIVFGDTKFGVERLAKELRSRGFNTEEIHGGKSQAQRQKALQKFKDSQADILVATDVAARGIDVSDITHVINYSIPNNYDDYVHRIGRAGRAGRVGYALTFIAGHN